MAAEPDAGIRFLLDGEIHAIDEIAPGTMLLDYLREHLRRTGTKEGCAEGDCGACTVVLAELDGEELRYQAVNSCIRFVHTLDGKALFTVESLRRLGGGELHPVQRSMVECHASQCGFCTPGFVMSLFALYQHDAAPDDAAIRAALSGNLCRCTGYRPILEAARRMHQQPCAVPAAFEADLREALRGIAIRDDKRVDSACGSFIAPATTAALDACLAQSPAATILAGGTDIGLWVTKQYRAMPVLVYLGNVAELREIRRDADALEIGAAVSLTEAFAALAEEYPDLTPYFRRFASPPICNSGTLAGNIANGSPIGDSMPPLVALDAELRIRSARGLRLLPLDAFYMGYQRKDLAPGEYVAAVRVPRPRAGRHLRAWKIAKRHDQDISAVCAAFAIELADGAVSEARICFGGMAAIPQRAGACERALQGAPWCEASIESAVAALAGDFTPISDLRASSEYRSRVAGNLLRRFHAEVQP